MRLIYEMRILQISQLISTIDDGQNPQGCHCSEKKPPPAVDEEEDCGITLSTRYTDDADDKPSSKDSEKARHIARLSILLFCKTDDMFHGPVSWRTCRRAEAKDRYQQQSNLHASDDDDDNITDDDGFSTVLQTVGTLPAGYVRSAPLPRLVPERHKTAASRVHSIQRRPALSVGACAMLTMMLPMTANNRL